jgi:A/G-specific adenine glycosylase
MAALANLRRSLMDWYRPRRRAYPWRVLPDPYGVLVSEVMLQQTQASRVVPAFERFLARFPSIAALARAPRSDVVRAWSGLGYNRRAVALSDAARAVVRDHDGLIPRTPTELVSLPGVGPYTAAAVASLAFGEPVAAVDTNVRRVVARALLGVDGEEAPVVDVRDAAESWLDPSDPGAFNQALMDLGREVCRRLPRCEACPLSSGCRFRRAGRPIAMKRRPQPAFDGSSRQLRGRVVEALRSRPSASLADLTRDTGAALARVSQVVRALASEGMIRAGPSAMSGGPRGRVALAD